MYRRAFKLPRAWRRGSARNEFNRKSLGFSIFNLKYITRDKLSREYEIVRVFSKICIIVETLMKSRINKNRIVTGKNEHYNGIFFYLFFLPSRRHRRHLPRNLHFCRNEIHAARTAKKLTFLVRPETLILHAYTTAVYIP